MRLGYEASRVQNWAATTSCRGHHVICIAVVVLLAIATCALGEEPPDAGTQQEEENTGQDFTKPLSRLDVRYKYQQVTGDLNLHMGTLRLDKPFVLGGGRQLSTRFDLPILHTNVPSRDNTDGDYETGLGDSLMQALLISPPIGRGAAAFGTQVILPTGTEDHFGAGGSLRLRRRCA